MIKKIDHLFEEINHLEMTPPPFVWEQIEAELTRRNRRPALVCWQTDVTKKVVLIAGVLGAGLWSYILSTYIEDTPGFKQEVPTYVQYTSKHVNVYPASSEAPSSDRVKEFQTSSKNTLFVSNNLSSGIKNKENFEAEETSYKTSVTLSERSTIETENQKVPELLSALPAIESGESIKIYKDNEWIELKTVGVDDLIKNELADIPSIPVSKPIEYSYISPRFSLNDALASALKPGFYITPSLGANLTQVYYNSEVINPYFTSHSTFSGKFGHQVGVQLGYQFNNHWSLESGVFYNQYQQSFKEYNATMRRDGIMYIDQLDIPLMVRYSLILKKSETPNVLSFKAGLNYGSVFYYQVNSDEVFLTTNVLKSNHYDLDKIVYNSIQLGYTFCIDFDAYLTKRMAFNTSLGSIYQSQYTNFPFFNNDTKRPSQLSGSISVGIKFKF
jgi:hypothetical protein